MNFGVVGCGLVGSTSAYALVMSGVGRRCYRVEVLIHEAFAIAAAAIHWFRRAPPAAVRSSELSMPTTPKPSFTR